MLHLRGGSWQWVQTLKSVIPAWNTWKAIFLRNWVTLLYCHSSSVSSKNCVTLLYCHSSSVSSKNWVTLLYCHSSSVSSKNCLTLLYCHSSSVSIARIMWPIQPSAMEGRIFTSKFYYNTLQKWRENKFYERQYKVFITSEDVYKY